MGGVRCPTFGLIGATSQALPAKYHLAGLCLHPLDDVDEDDSDKCDCKPSQVPQQPTSRVESGNLALVYPSKPYQPCQVRCLKLS